MGKKKRKKTASGRRQSFSFKTLILLKIPKEQRDYIINEHKKIIEFGFDAIARSRHRRGFGAGAGDGSGSRCDGEEEVRILGNDDVFKELNVLCEPIMRYLSTHHNIHTEVCISEYGIQVKQVIIGIPKEWQPTNIADCTVN